MGKIRGVSEPVASIQYIQYSVFRSGTLNTGLDSPDEPSDAHTVIVRIVPAWFLRQDRCERKVKVRLAPVVMLNTLQASPAPTFFYPYEEFSDHIKAMKMVQQWEHTSRFGPVGDAQSSRANNARVLEYFSDCYPDQNEAVHKAELFLSIYDYIARNASLFSRKNLLEREGVSFSVEASLLRAVHHIFIACPEPASVAIKRVISLARAFERISPVG
jgi:hypothetical protein